MPASLYERAQRVFLYYRMIQGFHRSIQSSIETARMHEKYARSHRKLHAWSDASAEEATAKFHRAKARKTLGEMWTKLQKPDFPTLDE